MKVDLTVFVIGMLFIIPGYLLVSHYGGWQVAVGVVLISIGASVRRT